MAAEFIRILNKKKFVYIGHDLIKDYYTLMYMGLDQVCTGFDTAIAGYVVDPTKSNYNLKTLVFETLHYELQDEKEFAEENSQTDLMTESVFAVRSELVRCGKTSDETAGRDAA